ncbi:MAG: light-harvesting protein [Thermochromatium sp.]
MASQSSVNSEAEAQGFHQLFVQGVAVFVGFVVAAHILSWLWRPWQ